MIATVLIVDDEPDVESMMMQRFRRVIRRGEYRFLFARDGNQALDVLAREPDVDVVLTDISMPGMDGLTLLGHIIERHSLLKTVVVSAYGDMANIRTAMNRGASDFVTKPIDFSDLEVTLKKAIDDAHQLKDAVHRREDAERARTNLSRYFAPGMVELLAEEQEAFASPVAQDVAVLFIDMVGFTKMCAEETPAEVFGLLRGFFARVGSEVFAANGTIDKYLGDGMMASFGTPRPGPKDATNALKAALGMKRTIDSWNEERIAEKLKPIRVVIGLHYGPVLLGNIGDERRLEFATIGDTVNVASRLEGLARPLDSSIVLSETLVERMQKEGPEAKELLNGFHQREPQTIRGREEKMTVWTLG